MGVGIVVSCMTGVIEGVAAGVVANELLRRLNSTDEKVEESLREGDVDRAIQQANKNELDYIRDVITGVVSNRRDLPTEEAANLTEQYISDVRSSATRDR